MDNYYKLFQATYAAIKFVIGLNKAKPGRIVRYLLILLTILFLLSTALIVLPLYCINIFVDLYLRIKHGDKYAGMLKNLDLALESTEKVMSANVLFIIKRNGSYEEFEREVREKFKNVYDSCYKLRCQIETILGYKYYLKCDNNFDEFVQVVDDVTLNRDNIIDHLSENFMNASYMGNKSFRLFIFKQPIKWNQKADKAEHVIIVSVRHSVADGIPIASLMVNTMGGFELLPIGDKLKLNPTAEHSSELDDAYIYNNPFGQNNSFPRSNSENYLTFYLEDDVMYVPRIKAIKTKLKVDFGSVVMGCLLLALVTYAKKRNMDIKTLKVGGTLRPLDRETIDMLEGKFDYNKISNNVIGFFFNSPPNIASKTLTEIVQECHSTAREMKNAADIILLFAAVGLSHIFTTAVVRYILQSLFGSINIGISNAIGLKSATIGSHTVEVTAPFLSESTDIGFILGVWSLGGRMQLFFTGAKSVLNGRRDLDEILADCLKNISILYKEAGCAEN